MATEQERLDELTEKAQAYARKQAAELESKVASIRKRIEELADLRHEIEFAPRTKEETLSLCKTNLKERREEEFIQKMLLPHITLVREKHVDFLNPSDLRVHLLSDFNFYRWAYQWVSDDLVEKAVALLPDGGIPEKERVKKISEINSKISSLEKEIEGLLK